MTDDRRLTDHATGSDVAVGGIAYAARSDSTYLTLPYLTLPLGRASFYTYPALRPYQFGPMHSHDVAVGHSSILVVHANCIRDIGLTLFSSSCPSGCGRKMEYRSCIRARHLPRKW